MFPPFAGYIIDQDEEETFTVHMGLDSLEQDVSKIDPYDWVCKCFGGAGEPYRFKIDEVLVSSAWSPNFSIVEHYTSPDGRVLLAGDACMWIWSMEEEILTNDRSSERPARWTRYE